MKYTLIFVFPGTNCETETFTWFANNLQTHVEYFNESKHQNLTAEDIDAIILPGGFSFGDYLRAGAIAARSSEMNFVKRMAKDRVPILGICNGFQILCESGLLEGALAKNITQQHHHFPVALRIHESFFHPNKKPCVWLPKISNKKIREQITKMYASVTIPMSCGTGRYVCVDNASGSRIKPGMTNPKPGMTNEVLFYLNNENGSTAAIAGITNKQGNILGLMPHPERASSKFVGNTDGFIFLLGLALNKKISIKPKSELAYFYAGVARKQSNHHLSEGPNRRLISASTGSS